MIPSTLSISGVFTGFEDKHQTDILLFKVHQDLSAAIDDEFGLGATEVFKAAWREKSALPTGGQEELAYLAADIAGCVSTAMLRAGSRDSRQKGGREWMINVLRNCASKSRPSKSVFETKRKRGDTEKIQARHHHELGNKCREAEGLLVEGFRSKMAARDQRGRVGGCRGCTIESMAHSDTVPGSLGGRFHTCLEPEEIETKEEDTLKEEARSPGQATKQGSVFHKAWASLSSTADSLSRGTWLGLGVAGIWMTLAMVALASASNRASEETWMRMGNDSFRQSFSGDQMRHLAGMRGQTWDCRE